MLKIFTINNLQKLDYFLLADLQINLLNIRMYVFVWVY